MYFRLCKDRNHGAGHNAYDPIEKYLFQLYAEIEPQINTFALEYLPHRLIQYYKFILPAAHSQLLCIFERMHSLA